MTPQTVPKAKKRSQAVAGDTMPEIPSTKLVMAKRDFLLGGDDSSFITASPHSDIAFISNCLPLHQHLERAAHHFGVEKLLDRRAFLAGLAGGAFDNLRNLGFSNLQ
jgi:hypothetical protein